MKTKTAPTMETILQQALELPEIDQMILVQEIAANITMIDDGSDLSPGVKADLDASIPVQLEELRRTGGIPFDKGRAMILNSIKQRYGKV